MQEPNKSYSVREAFAEDYPRVIATLTNAFAKDPVMSKAMGGKLRTQKIKELFGFQIRTSYAPHGKIDLAITEEGQVLGAALWMSPQGQRVSITSDLKHLGGYTKALGSSVVSAALTEYKLLAARPKFPHWYLYAIGVDSAARSMGVGGALLDYRLKELGEYPAYLEASTFRNASLYRRHGFVELGPFASGKPAVGMWHPAPQSAIDNHL